MIQRRVSDMKKFGKIVLAIAAVLGIAVSANILCEIFSTNLNKYYKVEKDL